MPLKLAMKLKTARHARVRNDRTDSPVNAPHARMHVEKRIGKIVSIVSHDLSELGSSGINDIQTLTSI